MKKTLMLVLVVALAAAILISCSTPAAPSAAADTSLADIKAKGNFILGMDDAFPPMGYKDESGNLTGFDVDLATEVAKRMGVELKLQPIDWKAKEMELNNKNIDVIWNGFSITEERKKTVLFSIPYMENTQLVVVLDKSDVQTLADLKDKQVAVQDGSSAQGALQSADADLLATITQVDFKDNVAALMDLKNGNVDAVAMDSIVADYYTSKEPGTYRSLKETLAPEQFGIGFRMGDQSFCDEVNKQLDAMIADGTFKTISTKWFGRDVSLAK